MQEPETQEQPTPQAPEQIQVIQGNVPRKAQRADDVVLTQCMLCLLLVLVVFALHWLQPEWQAMLLDAYRSNRDAAPVGWLDKLLRSFQAWLTA